MKKTTKIDPREALYRALGHLCVRFQDLEQAVKHFVMSVLQADTLEVGLIITSELSFLRLCHVARAVAKEKKLKVEGISSIDELFDKIEKAEETRNQLIHSVWEENPEYSDAINRSKFNVRKKGWTYTSVAVKPSDIENSAEEMDYLSRILIAQFSDRHLSLVLGQKAV